MLGKQIGTSVTNVRSLDGLVLIEGDESKLFLLQLGKCIQNNKHLPKLELICGNTFLSEYYSDLTGQFQQAWEDYNFLMNRYDRDCSIWASRIPRNTLLGYTFHYIKDESSKKGYTLDLCQNNFGVSNQGVLIFRDPIRR